MNTRDNVIYLLPIVKAFRVAHTNTVPTTVALRQVLSWVPTPIALRRPTYLCAGQFLHIGVYYGRDLLKIMALWRGGAGAGTAPGRPPC